MYYVIDLLLNSNLIIFGLFSILLFFLVSFFWNSIVYKYFHINEYKQVQRIHDADLEISRLGGLIIFISIYFWYFNSDVDNELVDFVGHFMLFSLPLMLVSLKEDLFHNVKPIIRLLAIVVSVYFLLASQRYGLPLIDMPVIGPFINNSFYALIFFTIVLSGYVNGVNLIDGSNGISAVTIMASLSSICFLSYIQHDLLLLQASLLFVFFILIFAFFNYPWGKIFLGDSGAYFLGLMSGYLTIVFFARHPDIPTWGAVLILFYPSFEMIFSVIRKLKNKKNPLYPDEDHLHLKLFYLIRYSIKRSRVANGMVMPLLTLFWLTPPVLVPWLYTNKFLSLLSIILLIIMYIGFYWSLPNKKSYQGKV